MSHLQVRDVCAMGSSCRHWRELSKSDPVWESLTRLRWPSYRGPGSGSGSDPLYPGWREIYIWMHLQTADRLSPVIQFVEQCSLFWGDGSIEGREYYRAIEDLCSVKPGFLDIQMFFFQTGPECAAQFDWLALLHFLSSSIVALKSCKISERKCGIRWWKMGRWFYGFHMRDETPNRWVSLEDRTTEEGADVRIILA